MLLLHHHVSFVCKKVSFEVENSHFKCQIWIADAKETLELYDDFQLGERCAKI